MGDVATSAVLVLGAGPAGCGAASCLAARKHEDWCIIEKEREPGGLSGSVRDQHGFSWDYGGHVYFGHEARFWDTIENVGLDFIDHERQSFVWFDGKRVPFPFERNLADLPPSVATDCMMGLAYAHFNPERMPPANFSEHLTSAFGSGVCDHYLRPYNEKLWGAPLERMGTQWLADRVPGAAFEQTVGRMFGCEQDVGWGPNSRFRYPAEGGSGEPYRRITAKVGEHAQCGTAVSRILARRREAELVSLSQGGPARTMRVAYETIISTLPLPALVALLDDAEPELRAAAASLEARAILAIGIGAKVPTPTDWHWLYLPESQSLHHRVVNHGRYSPDNVPSGRQDQYASFLFERASSGETPTNAIESAVGEARHLGLIPDDSAVVSTIAFPIAPAYPVPTTGRDWALRYIDGSLRARGIVSAGRFGGWRYERGNMDHAFEAGWQAASECLAEAGDECAA